MDTNTLARNDIVELGAADVARVRERRRRRKLALLFLVLTGFEVYLLYRFASGDPVAPGLPVVPEWWAEYLPALVLSLLLPAVIIVPMITAGRSPHVLFRPSEIEVGLEDVVGMPNVKEEVVRSLNLFLGFKTFKDAMGGTPRRALLFEGPPGTGKTYMAKAMAREAGVPFFFVSASSFQSMYYGQTNRKIRSYFKALRKAASREGGAIGFIDEFDAIGVSRAGMQSAATPTASPSTASVHRSSTVHEGVSGIVNELLVQLQSFDTPTTFGRAWGKVLDSLNAWLPLGHQVPKPKPKRANILVIGATNRASALDPALIRPGRFDRTIHFGLPAKDGRREIVDYYLDRKKHDRDLDREERRDALATMTAGYSPVMIEHLFDEALVWALRGGYDAMSWADIHQAKLTEETGIKQPVAYVDEERRRIATHESGHAVVAYLAGKGRRLDVLSIVKRAEALGLLAHSDSEERFTLTRSELLARVHIALGGLVAEEQFFGEWSTGPASDLEFATSIAARMVGSFGMAGSLVAIGVDRVLADEVSRRRVDELLDDALEDVRRLLETNRQLVEALRDALLTRDELIGDEILAVLREADSTIDIRDEVVDRLLEGANEGAAGGAGEDDR